MNIITMDTIYYVLGIIVAFIAVRIAFVVSIQIDLVLVYFGRCLPLHFIRKCNSFVLRWLYRTRYGCVSVNE